MQDMDACSGARTKDNKRPLEERTMLRHDLFPGLAIPDRL